MDDQAISRLVFLARTYDEITSTIVSTKQRLAHMKSAEDPEMDDLVQMLTKVKDKNKRQLERHLEYWPIWSHWMKGVPGCGPFIGSNMIILYYYRFAPICKDCSGVLIRVEKNDEERGGFVCEDCGKKAKSDGLLVYRTERKHFPKVSSWWKYMGMHCDETGHKPKLKKGVVAKWSTRGRMICYQLSDQFVRNPKTLYGQFLTDRKRKRESTHPEASKGHRHAMARNEAAKLFLAHFFQVAKTLDGEVFTRPYAEVIMGHNNIIEPYYFDPSMYGADVAA